MVALVAGDELSADVSVGVCGLWGVACESGPDGTASLVASALASDPLTVASLEAALTSAPSVDGAVDWAVDWAVDDCVSGWAPGARSER